MRLQIRTTTAQMLAAGATAALVDRISGLPPQLVAVLPAALGALLPDMPLLLSSWWSARWYRVRIPGVRIRTVLAILLLFAALAIFVGARIFYRGLHIPLTVAVASSLVVALSWYRMGIHRLDRRYVAGIGLITGSILAVLTAAILFVPWSRIPPLWLWIAATVLASVVAGRFLASAGYAYVLHHPAAILLGAVAAMVLWARSGAWWMVWMALGHITHLAAEPFIGPTGIPFRGRLLVTRFSRPSPIPGLLAVLATLGLFLSVADVRSLHLVKMRYPLPALIGYMKPSPYFPDRWRRPPWNGARNAAIVLALVGGAGAGIALFQGSHLHRAGRVLNWPGPRVEGVGVSGTAGKVSGCVVYIPHDLPVHAGTMSVVVPRSNGASLETMTTPKGFHLWPRVEVEGIAVAPAAVSAVGCMAAEEGEPVRFTDLPTEVSAALGMGLQQARSLGHCVLTEWHLILGMTRDAQSPLCQRLRSGALAEVRKLPSCPELKDLSMAGVLVSPALTRVLARASAIARIRTPEYGATWFPIWIALAEPSCRISRFVNRLGLTVEETYDRWNAQESESAERQPPVQRPQTHMEQRPAEDSGQARPVEMGSAISEYTTDLVEKARCGEIENPVGRDAIFRRMIETLLHSERASPVLIGDAGVGKTAIVYRFAHALAHAPHTLPERLRGKRLVSLDVGMLVAGTAWRGTFEERMVRLTRELEQNPDVIVFIDEVHMIAGAGQAEMGAVTGAGQYLKPVLSRGRMRVIGATTFPEYKQHIEKDPALARRFNPIVVPEPSKEEIMEMAGSIVERLERSHRVKIRQDAVLRAIEWSIRYITDERMPSKLVRILDSAASAVESRGGGVVTVDDVAAKVSERTGVPVGEITASEQERLSRLEEKLACSVIGQEEAIRRVAGAVRLARVGLADERRPVAVLLFYGPTGVGKTELAKATARVVFGDEKALVTVNMSEFQDRYMVSRLIGAPPGYIGHGEGGQLTEAVRRRPYCVVLFDEIDKAHPEVLHVLLRIFDEGKVEDSSGLTVDFTNTVIIATSNAGAEVWRGVDPDDPDAVAAATEHVSLVLRRSLRPEFYNRLTPVPFRPLPREVVRKIVEMRLREVLLRVQKNYPDLVIDVAPEVYEWLCREGFDPELGARPLARLIESSVTEPISKVLVETGTKRGKITVGFDPAASAVTIRGPR